MNCFSNTLSSNLSTLNYTHYIASWRCASSGDQELRSWSGQSFNHMVYSVFGEDRHDELANMDKS